MLKAILFDFDGVIADSVESIFGWFQHIASILDIELPVKTTEEMRENFMEPYPDLYKFLGFNWDRDRNRIFNEYVDYHSKGPVVLVEGIKGVIETLSLQPDIKLAIVSSNEQTILDKNLDYHDMAKYFDTVIGTDTNNNVPLKPDPTSILMALDRLEIALSESVYIGDQPSDVLAAYNASLLRPKEKMLTIALTTGFATKDRLISTNPQADHILDHPADILDVLDFQNKATRTG